MTEPRSNARDNADIGRIEVTPGVCAGKPRIAGTRIPTKTIWSWANDGASIDDILSQYPWITVADATAAIAFEQGRRYQKRKAQ